MRLSVSAARNGALVINMVLTAARRASVWVVFIFIMLLLSVDGCWFLTLETNYRMHQLPAMGCNPTGQFGELSGEDQLGLNLNSPNPLRSDEHTSELQSPCNL